MQLTSKYRSPWRNLPHYKSQSIDVNSQEGLPLKVDSSFQHLWCHVPGGSNLGGKENEGEEGRERDGGREADIFHYMLSLHNTLATSQDRNCRANM